MTQRPLVVVGAGPAGMAAAIAAAEAGLRPLVLDENVDVGGQVYRQPVVDHESCSARSCSDSSGTDRVGKPGGILAPFGSKLLDRFRTLKDRMRVETRAVVWGVFPPRRVAVSRDGSWDMIEAEQLILAPGAYEYVPPFPGWTLPGVMTPGGAQVLAKAMHVRPGQRAVVAGTGPFLLVVAEQLHRSGVKVAAVVEAAGKRAALRAVPGLLARPDLFCQGLGYLYRLRRAGIPIFRGHLVIEAHGQEDVEEVVLAPCDAAWRPDPKRAWSIAADTLCVGYGFVPRTQLAQLAGCRLRHAAELGGWLPVLDENQQTSVPGVWVAGDGSGVAGALVAEEEGRLAGLGAAHQLGALDTAAWAREREPILRRLRRLRRFRAALDRLSAIRPGLIDLAGPDTVVCRCEELTRQEIETGSGYGGSDLPTLKVMTRLGMGPCQGRMCWPAMARLIAARKGKSLDQIGPLSVRPPVKPVSVGELAGMGVSDEWVSGEW
jgi:NADPH-dependent 2,4-dienoyl-CoA reductase/sulfur reductase-like enzyme